MKHPPALRPTPQSGTSRQRPVRTPTSCWLRDQAQAALRDMFGDLWRQLPKLGQPNNHVAVHQLRVRTRRLRAGLDLFGPLCHRQDRELITQPLRRLGQGLGQVRVCDVNRHRLAQVADRNAPMAALLDRVWATQRRELLAALRQQLGVRSLADWRLRTDRLLRARRACSDAQLLHHSTRQLQHRRKMLRRRVKRFDRQPTDRRFHRLRIALKQYRYALEWAEKLLAWPVQPQLQRLARLQRAMGQAHDFEVAAADARRHERAHKELASQLRPMVKALRQQQAAHVRQAQRLLGGQRTWLKKLKRTRLP